MDYVLGVGGFDLARVVDDGAFKLEEPPEEHSHDHSHSHAHSHDHAHDHAHSHSHGADGHAEPGCSECESAAAAAATSCSEPACTDPSHDHGHAHSHRHSHAHSDPVGSVSLQLVGDLDLDLINDWLGDLMAERWQDLYRLKGVLAIEGFPERYVVQGVHALFEGQVDRMWGDNERRASKLVFIGKDLNAEELRKGFEACKA